MREGLGPMLRNLCGSGLFLFASVPPSSHEVYVFTSMAQLPLLYVAFPPPIRIPLFGFFGTLVPVYSRKSASNVWSPCPPFCTDALFPPRLLANDHVPRCSVGRNPRLDAF